MGQVSGRSRTESQGYLNMLQDQREESAEGGLGHTLSVTKADLSFFPQDGWLLTGRSCRNSTCSFQWLVEDEHVTHFWPMRRKDESAEVTWKSVSSVQSLSRVRLFATPWTTALQPSLSITNSQSLLKPMSIVSVMPSNHLIPCHPLLLRLSIFPSIRVFSKEWVLQSGGQTIGVSASASVLPMNTQDWFPLGWTGWISLLSKGISRVFLNTTVQKHQFFGAQLSL